MKLYTKIIFALAAFGSFLGAEAMQNRQPEMAAESSEPAKKRTRRTRTQENQPTEAVAPAQVHAAPAVAGQSYIEHLPRDVQGLILQALITPNRLVNKDQETTNVAQDDRSAEEICKDMRALMCASKNLASLRNNQYIHTPLLQALTAKTEGDPVKAALELRTPEAGKWLYYHYLDKHMGYFVNNFFDGKKAWQYANNNVEAEILKYCIRKNGVGAWAYFKCSDKFEKIAFALTNLHRFINFRTIHGAFFLAEACKNGNLPLAQWLMQHGAQFEKEKEGFANTAADTFSWCLEKNHKEIIKFLIDTPEVNLKNSLLSTASSRSGLDALRYAVENNHIDAVKFCLKIGFNPKFIKSKTSYSGVHELLITAANKKYKEIVKLLLTTDLHPDNSDIYGSTALIKASQNSDVEIAQLLIQAGANVNHQNKTGKNALMIAAQNGCPELIKLLLSHPKIDLTGKDKKGRTALMIAEQSKRKNKNEIIELLKKAGAQ